jgi:predicted dinucleotide-binding enzyme
MSSNKKKIGILGSGTVAQTLALGLIAGGYPVQVGTRDAAKTRANTAPNRWGAPGPGAFYQAHPEVALVSLSEAAAWGEILVNATSGSGTLEALATAGADHLGNKVLVDLANPLDFSQGFPPTLSVVNTDSLGEQVQRAFPKVRVVKTLNTLNAELMLNPTKVGAGDHTLFLSGNDAAAKAEIKALLVDFGWRDLIDLGDITTARGTEQLLPVWVRLMGTLGHANFQFKVVR